ncbi:geranylgeranyl reductase family protein [Methanolapillus ohkumae]|uniref:Thiamine thiazole synthase n=1 Tax=Methanolapillus ohkumae TaxID=3028298 RepID=A0AA97A5P5_9EURY|nr:Thiamine thiazole synthase [Methanosarcinaceae archaeon Am2]
MNFTNLSSIENEYDIIVVGAGPAGSMAAKYAAIDGARVLLVDKKKVIGKPMQCAGFIPEAFEIEKLIPDLVLPEEMKNIPQHCIRAKTKTQRLTSPDLNSKDFLVSGFVLDRERFDCQLAKQALMAGADVLQDARVTQIQKTKDGEFESVLIQFGGESDDKSGGESRKREIFGKIIIGADGPSSFVGKTFRLVHSESEKTNSGAPYERGIGFEYKMENVDTDMETLDMYFGNRYVPGGYVWIFPEGNGKANVGLGLRRSLCSEKTPATMSEKLSAKAFLDRFILEHPIASQKLKSATITAQTGGIIPVAGAPPKTAAKTALVAGDAAGHVMATNGGGIPFALAAGKIAGQVAAKQIQKQNSGNGFSVLEYDSIWREQFGDALLATVQARKLMDKFIVSDKLMNAAFKLLPADRLKAMQCGDLPKPVKTGLNLLLR